MRIAILIFAAAALCAQTFEVASVKVNKSGDGSAGGPRLVKGKLTAKNSSMRWILEAAWGLQEQQIVGPAWIDSDRFDLAGTAPADVPDTEIKPMLQALLKDRFQLVAHLERREMAVYNLVVVKDGAKIKPFDISEPHNPTRMPGYANMLVGNMTLDGFASMLTRPSGKPVIDNTSLKGRYYIEVQFNPLDTVSEPDHGADIFAALQQQLGLKLEPAKAELDVLVVDHLERVPTEN